MWWPEFPCDLTVWSAVRKHLFLVYQVRCTSNGLSMRKQLKIANFGTLGLSGSMWKWAVSQPIVCASGAVTFYEATRWAGIGPTAGHVAGVHWLLACASRRRQVTHFLIREAMRRAATGLCSPTRAGHIAQQEPSIEASGVPWMNAMCPGATSGPDRAELGSPKSRPWAEKWLGFFWAINRSVSPLFSSFSTCSFGEYFHRASTLSPLHLHHKKRIKGALLIIIFLKFGASQLLQIFGQLRCVLVLMLYRAHSLDC